LALSAGSTNFIEISRAFFQPSSLNTAHLLAFFALFIVAVAETGRIPVDNPDTHLELTMVHEGMILEYSGKELGLIVWSTQIKQLIILTFLANLFFPIGIAEQLTITQLGFALMAYLIKVLILALGLAGVETAFAKLRLFKVPSLLGISFMLSVFAMVSVFVIGGKL
ncbi:MAG TPA: NADH-quinone oxidoreductase subunit H, partial [Verrucomicrobiae bacterium]|nr:NADH-quinone oxidoreductase subunit H [Verrucomicrobiae bacterium]